MGSCRAASTISRVVKHRSFSTSASAASCWWTFLKATWPWLVLSSALNNIKKGKAGHATLIIGLIQHIESITQWKSYCTRALTRIMTKLKSEMLKCWSSSWPEGKSLSADKKMLFQEVYYSISDILLFLSDLCIEQCNTVFNVILLKISVLVDLTTGVTVLTAGVVLYYTTRPSCSRGSKYSLRLKLTLF